ncbi:MAG: hypothetical protein HQK60_03955 [Deltaproteobacteria bacterium]|nr:hypothetical protein [Deltaproteobacteria bacterium]
MWNRPKRIIVEKGVQDTPLTRRILRRLPLLPVEEVEKVPDHRSFDHQPDVLILARNRGAFIKKCPCTPLYTGCGYHVVNLVWNCPIQCTYCILQEYFKTSGIRLAANLDDLVEEIDAWTSSARPLVRIGTGEFGDSLALEELTGLSQWLVPQFAGRSRAVLELKTKSINVDRLDNLDHGGRVVVSWSLNTEELTRSEEARAPGIIQRLTAARRCRDWGYRIGFHFDPMIHTPGWEEGYRKTIDRIFDYVAPRDIAWISLGTLRFMPALKPIIEARWPASQITTGEFIIGLDGKCDTSNLSG